MLLRGENVVDQTREICGGALDLAQIQRLFRSDGSANAELQELGVTGNGVERRAKLVTHHPQKERLRAVGVLGFLAGVARFSEGRRDLAVAPIQFLIRALQPQQIPHPDTELRAIQGFGEKVLRSAAQPGHSRFAIVQRREHDDGNVPGGGVGLDRTRHLIAVHAVHQNVEQDEVGWLPQHRR